MSKKPAAKGSGDASQDKLANEFVDKCWDAGTPEHDSLDVLTRLLDQGVDINFRNGRGASGIVNAASNGNLAAVNFLIGKGANVNSANKKGWTALHWAAEGGRKPMIDALLSAGASTTKKLGPNNGKMSDLTPAGVAEHCGYKEVAAYLNKQPAKAAGGSNRASRRGSKRGGPAKTPARAAGKSAKPAAGGAKKSAKPAARKGRSAKP